MKSQIFTAGLIAGMFLLAGCTGQELYGAQKVTPTGSEFSKNLYHGYIGLSESEYAEGDYIDSDQFALRAVTAGADGDVLPEEIDSRGLPADHVAELTEARSKLMTVINTGSARKMPADTAQAQIMFDCWMQEQEENWQPDDIAACRDGFYTAYNKIAPAPQTAAKPKAQKIRFVVYFENNKADLDDSARAVLAEAQEAAKKLGDVAVTIDGNADTVGATDYNLKLSALRAEAVAKVLGTGEIATTTIVTNAHGETRPAVVTADEIAEPRNRRVEILIEQ